MNETVKEAALLPVRSNAGLGERCGRCQGTGSVRKFEDFQTGYWTDCPNCLPDGVPCGHAGCLNHISHPCEGCGRVGGKRTPNVE